MIEAKKVNFEYLESFTLKNISLKVQKGKILGIIGQSGSGKTTLLKLLAGLKEPSSGQITINGTTLEPPSKKLIAGHKQIKMVTQQNTLFPNVNISENIAYEVRFFEKKYQNQRVSTLAKELNISQLLGEFPRELSGGEIQRVMLAKAIADEPLLLLLDEPTTNLDAEGISLYHQLIAEHTYQKMVIISSNDPQEYSFCDEVIAIANYK
jgi:iron(III) transport system ATP-binding protein